MIRMKHTTELKDVAVWRRMRYIVVALNLIYFSLCYGLRSSLSIAIVAMTNNKTSQGTEYMDWDQSVQSSVLSAFFWGLIATTLPSALLIQKYGTRWLLLITALLLMVTSFVLPIITTSYGWVGLYVLRVVQGSNIGNFLALLSSGPLASSDGGWPAIFYFQGSLLLAWCILWFFFGFDEPARHPYTSRQESAYIQSFYRTFTRPSFKTPIKEMAQSVPLWSYLACICGVGWCAFIYTTQLPSYMDLVLGFDIQSNGLLSSLPSLAYVLTSSIFYPWMFAILLNKFSFKFSNARRFFTGIGCLGPMFTMIAVSFVSTKEWAVFFFVLTYALAASQTVGFLQGAMELAPNFTAFLAALAGQLGNVFGIVVPYISAAIVTDRESADDWRILFWITAGIFLAMFVVYMLFSSNKVQPWNFIEEEKTILSKSNENSTESIQSVT